MLATQVQKTIRVRTNIDFSFLKFNNNNFIIITTKTGKKKYLSVPKFINLSKIDDYLIIKAHLNQNTSILFHQFLLILNLWIKRIDKPFKKKLVLKGLGFKISLTDDNKNLELKLGYSHIIKLDVPNDEIALKIEKNSLVVHGFDPVQVGNFVNKVRQLKFPDVYKGKGFWSKNESITLKEVKKT